MADQWLCTSTSVIGHAVGEGRSVGRILDRGGLVEAWHDVMWMGGSSHLCTMQHVVYLGSHNVVNGSMRSGMS